MMTEAKLKRLAQKWQRILRLQDWDIEIAPVQAEHVDRQAGNTALCERQVNEHAATIPIAMMQQDKEIVEDMVHELLHVKLTPLELLYRNVRQLVGPIASNLAESCWDDIDEPLVSELAHALLEVHGYGD